MLAALPEHRASAGQARPIGAVLGTDSLEMVGNTHRKLAGPAWIVRKEVTPDVPMAGARHRLLGGGGRLPVVLIVVNLR